MSFSVRRQQEENFTHFSNYHFNLKTKHLILICDSLLGESESDITICVQSTNFSASLLKTD